MNCSVCGAMIPDGQAVCPNCGTAVQPVYQQPQQPMYQQPQQQMYQQPMYQQPQQQMYQQPMYQAPQPAGGGIGGYFGSFGKNPMMIVKFVACVLLFLSPFFAWVKVSFWGVSESANLFKLKMGLTTFCAIMIMALAAFMIVLELADFVPAIGGLKNALAKVPFVDLIIVGVALVFVLIATIKSTADMMGLGKHAFGCILAWLAVIAAAVPSVMKMIKK